MRALWIAILLSACGGDDMTMEPPPPPVPDAGPLPMNTSLSDLAASLEPGEWGELQTTGFDQALLENGCIGNILNYSDSAMWDPIAHQFVFLGSPHCGGVGNGHKQIVYDEATNAWSSCIFSDAGCPAEAIDDYGHAYDHNTIDPATRTWYRRIYNSETVRRWDLAGNGWTDLAPMDQGYTQVAGGLAWFPELYGVGGLVFVQGGAGEIHLWNQETGQWHMEATGLAMAGYHNIAEYSPLHQVVVAGGGNDSHDLYRIDADGTVTTLAPAPIGIGIHQTVVVADPVSGDLLVFGEDSVFYAFDPIADTWTVQSSAVPFFPVPSMSEQIITGIVATPVSSYGVVLFVQHDGATPKVYVYKHSV